MSAVVGTHSGISRTQSRQLHRARTHFRIRALSSAVLAVPLAAVVGAFGLRTPLAGAAVIVKNSTAGPLNDTTGIYWIGGVSPGPADIALYNVSTGGAQTDSVGGPVTIGEIQVTNPTGAQTISDATQGNVLTLAGVNNIGGTPIGIDLSAATTNLTINASLAVSSNQTWSIAPGRQLTLGGGTNSSTAGSQALTIANGTNNITVNGGGTLFVDYYNSEVVSGGTGNWILNGSTISTTSIKGASTFITLTNALGTGGLTVAGSSYIYAVGASAGTNTQTFSTLTVNPGFTNFITGTRGASSGFNLQFSAQPSRNIGGVLNLVNAGNSPYNEEIGGASTTLGYATAGSNDFALTHGVGGAAANSIGAATYTSDVWAPGNNTTVTTNDAPASGSSTNTLRFNNAGAFTVSLSGVNVITGGGVLMGSVVGTNSSTVTGGSITSGIVNADGTSDLILLNNDNSTGGGNLVINSNIVDNPTGPVSVGLTIANTTTNGATGNIPGSTKLGGTNTFTGPVYIDGASVVLTAPGAWNGQALNFAPAGSVGSTTNVGTLSLGGNSITVSGLNTTQTGLSAVVQNASSTPATLTISNSGLSTYGGTIKDASGGGSLSLVTSGTGTQILSGTLSYTGSTTVTGGTLKLAQTGTANPLAASPVITVASGATLDLTGLSTSAITLGTQTLAGGGTINGSISAGSGSVVQPGTLTGGLAGTGMLVINNSLTLNSGSSINLGLSTSNATSNLIDVVGLLTLPATGKTTLNLYTPNTALPFGASGTYDLFQAGSLANASSLASEFTIGAGGSGFTPTFSTASGPGGSTYITLTLTQSSTISSWQGPTSDANWTTTTNWTNGVPSQPGDSATFATSGTPPTVILNAAESVGSITFNNSATYNISGNSTLTLDNKGSGANISVVTGSHIISTPVSLNDNLSVQPSAGTKLTIAGNISATSTAATLTVNGAGTLALTGSNTYGPAAGLVGTTLMQGILQVGSSTAVGAGDIAVAGNSTLQAGAAGLSLANNLNISTGITATVDTQANTFTLTGTISDAGGGILSKAGSGTLILSGNNTYAGGTVLNNGTIQISSAANLGATTGSLTFIGGTLQLGATFTTARNWVIDSGQTAVLDTNSFGLTDTGIISSVGAATGTFANGLIVTSSNPTPGMLTLGGNNTFVGQTGINNATLTLSSANALQDSTLNYNNPTGILSFGTLAAATFAGLAGNQPLALTNPGGGAVALSLGGTGLSSTYTGILSGTGSLTTNGSGTIVIGSGTTSTSGGASYTGGTTVNQGTLQIGGIGVMNGSAGISVSATNASNLIIADAAQVYTTGQMLLDNTTSGNSNPQASTLTVKNSATVVVGSLAIGNGAGRTGGGTFVTVQDSASLTVDGAYNLDNTFGASTAAANPVLNLNGGLLAVNSFIQSQSSTAHQATIHLNGGTLEALTNDSPAAYFIPAVTFLAIDVDAGGAIVNTNGNSVTIAQPLIHGSVVAGGTTDAGLTKNGLGMLTLSATNTYTGPTAINTGTLFLPDTGAPVAGTNLPTNTNLSIGSLASPASLIVASNGAGISTLRLGSLTLAGHTGAWTGLLDLASNAMVIHNGSTGTVANQIRQGYNGGSWTGSGGITSSYTANGSLSAASDSNHLTALGYMVNDTAANTTGVLSGTALYTTTPDGAATVDGDILVKYTYYGDANLSGVVDGSDYSLIDNGYLSQLTGWSNGDFNYDGVIDGSDYTLIDNAFNTQSASLASEIATATAQIGAPAASAVPEPTVLSLIGVGVVGLLGRRGRRHRN